MVHDVHRQQEMCNSGQYVRQRRAGVRVLFFSGALLIIAWSMRKPNSAEEVSQSFSLTARVNQHGAATATATTATATIDNSNIINNNNIIISNHNNNRNIKQFNSFNFALVAEKRLFTRSKRVQLFASKVGDVFAHLYERSNLDMMAKVAPFLRAADRKEFISLQQDRPQTLLSTLSENLPAENDTVAILHGKLRKLSSDDDVLSFRNELTVTLRQEIQKLIEVEQAETAELLADLSFEDQAEAEEAWQLFKDEFPKPAETGSYMGTPTKEADIKYRWRRLKETLDIDSDTALYMVKKEAAPLLCDPDFIRRAWLAMCRNLEGGRDEALNDLVLKSPNSLISDPDVIRERIGQLKAATDFIDMSGGALAWARNAIFGDGGKEAISQPSNARPTWRLLWEEEMKHQNQV